MLEKIKEVPFINESEAVRIISVDGKIVLERYDRVVWGREATSLETALDIDCYVEADRFFVLLPDIKSLELDTALHITLKNDAKYTLPFLDVAWETKEMPEEYDANILFNISDLQVCTLSNLIRPEFQCIYIDEKGAVTCDFVSSCISTAVKSPIPMLLPPDVQELVSGKLCKVKLTDEVMYFKGADFSIATSRPADSEEEWWNQLREMIPETPILKESKVFAEALKRLVLFGDYVKFDGEKALVGANYELFDFFDLGDNMYDIAKVKEILNVTSKIAEYQGNLIFANDNSIFIVSTNDEA